MADPVISAKGLTKHYGEHVVVDDLKLNIMPGEIFGLLGPNGAGKTTTILMLLGLTEPTAGTAQIAGFDPTFDALAVKASVGYLPDSVGFYDDLSGTENLRYTARLNRIPNKEIGGKIQHVLEEVGLSHAGDQLAGTYSRGMLQRLGIADALIKDPVVLILDEPTIAIDPEGVLEIQQLIRDLADHRDVTVLVSSHLLHQMQSICDRVAIFVDGKIVAQGTARELAGRLSGGRTTFEVDVGGPAGGARSALDRVAAGGSVTEDPLVANRWRVSLPAGQAHRIVEELVSDGIKVNQVRRTGEDLDEIYHRYFEEVAS
ncbi:MAG: ABC transporter ATP-binding protein [Acidimicrobiia bacterium]